MSIEISYRRDTTALTVVLAFAQFRCNNEWQCIQYASETRRTGRSAADVTLPKLPVSFSARRLATLADVSNGLRQSLMAITVGSTFRRATSGSLHGISQCIIHGPRYARCEVEKRHSRYQEPSNP